MSAREPLTDDEIVLILENLARNSSSATAQIQAIKALKEMQLGEQPAAEGFEALDADDEVAKRRSRRSQAA